MDNNQKDNIMKELKSIIKSELIINKINDIEEKINNNIISDKISNFNFKPIIEENNYLKNINSLIDKKYLI